jgi:hypothetical protein
MNRSILLCAGCIAVVGAVSCSNEAPAPPSGSHGGSSGTGGSQGSGGSNSGTGGDQSGSGGDQSGSGGDQSGSGGASDTGGSTGTGGDAAGGSTGTGGDVGTGGGGTGGGGGGGGLTPESIVPTLDGYLWIGQCANADGHGKDCPIHDDADGCVLTGAFDVLGAFRHAVHKVGGTAGTKYVINFEARGVTGGKTYNGGTRQTTATTYNETGNNDGWYVGGTPTPSKWNTYEIHVSPPVTGQPVNAAGVGGTTCPTCPKGPDNVYYTNAIPQADGIHETFPIKFKASFPVMGGGTITLVIHDSNCLGQQNCGPNKDPNAMCSDPRTIDISGMLPQPSSFNQPYTEDHAPDPWHPQWLLFDIQSITQ